MNKSEELRKLIEEQAKDIENDKKFDIDWSKKGNKSRFDYCHLQYIKGIGRNLEKNKKREGKT